MCLLCKNREEKIVSGCLHPDRSSREASGDRLRVGAMQLLAVGWRFGLEVRCFDRPTLTLPDRASSDTISEKLVLMAWLRRLPA
jgi:hypothetical protein